MIFKKDEIQEIEIYRDYKIVIEHNLNIFENIKDSEHPIYTICGLGRIFKGNIEGVRKFIDDMYGKYS